MFEVVFLAQFKVETPKCPPVFDPHGHQSVYSKAFERLSSPFKISSLVTLQLLTKVSHDDQLNAPKYKCSVSMDFICAIARWVE